MAFVDAAREAAHSILGSNPIQGRKAGSNPRPYPPAVSFPTQKIGPHGTKPAGEIFRTPLQPGLDLPAEEPTAPSNLRGLQNKWSFSPSPVDLAEFHSRLR